METSIKDKLNKLEITSLDQLLGDVIDNYTTGETGYFPRFGMRDIQESIDIEKTNLEKLNKISLADFIVQETKKLKSIDAFHTTYTNTNTAIEENAKQMLVKLRRVNPNKEQITVIKIKALDQLKEVIDNACNKIEESSITRSFVKKEFRLLKDNPVTYFESRRKKVEDKIKDLEDDFEDCLKNKGKKELLSNEIMSLFGI